MSRVPRLRNTELEDSHKYLKWVTSFTYNHIMGNTTFFFTMGMHTSWPYDTKIYGIRLSKIMLKPPSSSNITLDFKETQKFPGVLSTKVTQLNREQYVATPIILITHIL